MATPFGHNAAHGTHQYRCALNEWPLTTTAAVTLNTCYTRHQKRMKLYSIFLCISVTAKHTAFWCSLTYASLEDVCDGGGRWWGVVRSCRVIISYCIEGGENKVILLSWWCFRLSRGTKWNQKIGYRLRSKAMRTIPLKNCHNFCSVSKPSLSA